MNLCQIARALGGEVCSGQVLAPGPRHSRRDRSLAVRLSADSPDGFVVFSHAGDDWRDCADYVRSRLGLSRQHRDERPAQSPPAQSPQDERKRDLARALVRESVDPRGTLAERYLRDVRRLGDVLDDVTALSLRFHPQCVFRDGDTLARAPAIVAVVRGARAVMGACMRSGDADEVAREILRDLSLVEAVQRIRLDERARKVERRSLGPLGDDGVVFVGSPFEGFYGATATICEGVETALAMRRLGFEGCVALTGASRFRTFLPPHHWGRITIAAENDDGASERAWRDAGPRWAGEGRRVEIVAPADHRAKDANDLLLMREGANAA